jgi:hypothetical protein
MMDALGGLYEKGKSAENEQREGAEKRIGTNI